MASTHPRVEYVRNLVLPPPLTATTCVRASPDTIGLRGDSAAISAGGQPSFVSSLTPLQRDDVLNSILLAQLGASALYDRNSQRDQWYHKYKEILQECGWKVDEFSFGKQRLPRLRARTVNLAVIQFLELFCSVKLQNVRIPNLTPARLAQSRQLELMQRTIDNLRKRADTDPVVSVFTTASSHDDLANFQLGAYLLQVLFSIGAFKYRSDTIVTNALFSTIESESASFQAYFQDMILVEKDYAVV
ncbi:hypothetical protein FRC06_008952 [Ceratobasidium sp. 370]|nr:hypothetical protein FRC06_008952 [Ceratobasidium sp. 370]